MTKSMRKTLLGGMFILLMAFLLYRFWGMEMTDKRSYRISVILEDASSERWKLFKEGMEQAATEYHVELEICNINEEDEISVQEEIIAVQRENRADGIILDCADSSALNDYVRENSSIIPMVLVENDINDSFSGSYVSANNREMGKGISECIQKESKIGIISGYTSRNSNLDRLAGFKENISEEQIKWVLQDTSELADYVKRYPVDTLVILENVVADEFIEQMQEKNQEGLYRNTEIWVIGNSNKLVYFLDKGMINGMVVPNEFGMGYKAVESVVNIIHDNQVRDAEVSYTVITRENMYDSDIQRIIFPIVQ